jgi:hypothetical protein
MFKYQSKNSILMTIFNIGIIPKYNSLSLQMINRAYKYKIGILNT